MPRTKKNSLDKLEIEVAEEFTKRRVKRSKKRREAAKPLGRTRIAKNVRAGKRLPPPVPKNKSLKEITKMDPQSLEFRHKLGRKQSYSGRDPDTMTFRELMRADEQERKNGRRARVRKYEATVVKAQDTLEAHVTNSQSKEMDIYDEEKLIAEGILDMEDWDDEELIRGYRRTRAGKWGKPPAYIPREVQQEAFRRLVQRGSRKLSAAYVKSTEELVLLAHGAESEKVKLEAIKELMNRVVGKVPETMHVSLEQKPWEGILADSLVPIDELNVIEMATDDDGVAHMVPYMEEPERPGEVETRSESAKRHRGRPATESEAPSPGPPTKKKTKKKKTT